MRVALIIVPSAAAGPRYNRLDRKQRRHLTWLEYAAWSRDERNMFAILTSVSGPNLRGGDKTALSTEPLEIPENLHPQRSVWVTESA
jgi:hypothetical protein